MHTFILFLSSVAYEEPVYEVPVVSDADIPARKQQQHTLTGQNEAGEVLTGSTDMTSQVYHILEETATTDEANALATVVQGCDCDDSLLAGTAASLNRDVDNHMVVLQDSSANLYENLD